MSLALAPLLLLSGIAAASLVGRRADAAERPPILRAPRAAAPLAARNPARSVGGSERTDGSRPRRGSPEHLLADIERSMPLFARPGGTRVIGRVPAASPTYGEPTVAWILEVSRDGRFGRVPIPYVGRQGTGWLRLRGLRVRSSPVSVRADLSRHRLWLLRGDRAVFSTRAATGAPVSPTPTGRYVVSDLVAFPAGGPFGSYAFGLSGIQPNLPPGWTGGDQLAIHGTSDPASIGRSVSAGCRRVSERALDRLRRLLEVGTPVVVTA